MTTREAILNQRELFEKAGYPKFWGHWDMFRFQCFVLPAGLCTALPNFALQMVADDKTPDDLYHKPNHVALFGVSDAIPEEFRELVVYHEMVEYLGEHTCMQASIQEMNAFMNTPELNGRWNEYVRMRRALFDVLPKYAQTENYLSGKIAQFYGSQSFFRCID